MQGGGLKDARQAPAREIVDPLWLQRIVEQAVDKKWCVSTSLGCCGTKEVRRALGLARRWRINPKRAQEFVTGLKFVMPDESVNPEGAAPISGTGRSKRGCCTGFEPAVRFLIYTVWRSVGDDYFDELSGTYAGEVLERMRAHYQQRQMQEQLAWEIAQSETAGVPPGCCLADLPKETVVRLLHLLFFVRSPRRVCPKPRQWHAFYEHIRVRRTDRESEPRKPAILSAWYSSSDNFKANILRHQLEWAAAQGRLDVAESFLKRLDEDDWHYGSVSGRRVPYDIDKWGELLSPYDWALLRRNW